MFYAIANIVESGVKCVRYNVEHGDQFYWLLTPLSTMLVIA
jgi:hypothetical protein